MEHMIGQCYPRDFLRTMFNLTEEELDGQPFVKLGIQGILQVKVCIHENKETNFFHPFDPFRLI